MELKKIYEQQEAERRSQFEEERRQAEVDIREYEKSSLERIAAEKLELDEKIKEFDFSDHMRARRALREQITDEVQSSLRRPISSYSSSMKLAMVTLGTMVAIGGAGFFAFESFESFIALAKASQVSITVGDAATAPTQPPDNTYLLWMLAIRGFVLSAVAVGFTYYLVSMYRKSHEEEIRVMRELQRYGMDINRASWIIETAMEMTTKENAQIPDKWIEGTCAGLFQSGTVKDAEVNSLAALGAVLGLGPEIEAGPDGMKMKIGPKGSRQAAKDRE